MTLVYNLNMELRNKQKFYKFEEEKYVIFSFYLSVFYCASLCCLIILHFVIILYYNRFKLCN